MELSTSPLILASAVMVGAGVVAMTPALSRSHVSDAQVAAVQLTATEGLSDVLFGPDLSTIDSYHSEIFDFIAAHLSSSEPLLDFTTTYTSGVLIGELGTVLSPALALDNGVQDIIADLSGASPDPTAALSVLEALPAAVTQAFLYGYSGPDGDYTLDLTPLLSDLGVILPAGFSVSELNVPLGGLLSPGGTLFNDLNVAVEYVSGNRGEAMLAPSDGPIGPLNSLTDLSQAIEQALGATTTTTELPDLTSLLNDLLGNDAVSTLTNLSTDFHTFTTDALTALAGLI